MNNLPIRYLLFFIFSLSISEYSFSQIVDDSTKLIYGPRTTRYVTEQDVMFNSGNVYEVDTALSDIHNVYSLYQGKQIYQNLGNLGTPISPVYYIPPSSIGKNFGFNSFDAYAFNSAKIKYYDTRSPFTSIKYLQGGSGQQLGDAEFSRNIRPNWNFGFEIKRLTSNKLFGAVTPRERLADHTSFLFFTRFITGDSAYQVMANYTFLDHKNFETGGVLRQPGESLDDLFDYREEKAHLYNSRSMEKRSVYHLYHQLSLVPKELIQLFHVFDFYNQSNRFKTTTDRLFYPDRNYVPSDYYSETEYTDRTDFSSFENKAGLKGLVGNFYYRVYYRRKDFSYKQNFPGDSTRRFNENFAGGDLSYRIFEKVSLNASGEYLVSGNYLSKGGRDYMAKAELISNYVTGGYYRINHSPTLLQLKYNGNNFIWNNMDSDSSEFATTLSDNVYANGNLKWKSLTFNPGVNFSTVKNYTYFDTIALPKQESSSIQVMSLDAMVKLNWNWINIENFIKYTTVSNPGIIKVPEIYNHLRVYYQGRIFNKALLAQIGVDLFWKSDYFANHYMPITQQFYLNNYFLVENYLLADFFINVQLKRTNGFLRFSHVNQGLAGEGYFNTPYYPSLPRNFEFGIKWNFFD